MATANNTKIEVLNVAEIEIDPKWNARSNLEESSGGPDEGTGFDGLVASIKAKGQDTAIIVRHNKGGKKPFYLVAGFRRVSAILKIAEETKDKAPTVKAIVHDYTPYEARHLNIRENTVRDDLSGVDLAFGLADLASEADKANIKWTGTSFAESIGKSQPYVSTLLRIMKDVQKPILNDWRAQTAKISVQQMDKVSKVTDKAEQKAMYDEMVRGSSSEETATRGPDSWVGSAEKAAANMGAMLGRLVRNELIEILVDDFFTDHIRQLVKFKGDRADVKNGATKPQINKIVKAASKAYDAALVEVEAVAEENDDEEGEPTRGAKKIKGEARAEN